MKRKVMKSMMLLVSILGLATAAKVYGSTLVEQEIFNQDGITVTATGLNEGSMGPEVSVLIENNSEKMYTVQVRNSAVNGYMLEPMISEEVAPGKKANGAIKYLKKYLQERNIEEITDVEFSLHVFNSEDWQDSIDSEIIHLTTEDSDTYEQLYDDSGEILFDENGIKIVSKGMDEDNSMGPKLVLYFENNTDKNYTIQSRDTSVNGLMIDAMLSQDITGGNKALGGMTFLKSYFEKNNITSVSDIETQFHIFETDDWNSSFDSDVITVLFGDGTQENSTEGEIIFDQDGITIISQGIDYENTMGPKWKLYVKNNSESDITIQGRETSVNGYMIDGMMSMEVKAGKKMNGGMTFLKKYVEDNHIESFGEIETSLHIFNQDTFDTIIDTSPITVHFAE